MEEHGASEAHKNEFLNYEVLKIQKANNILKIYILRISKDFTVQTGSATADKAFIADLCDNI